MRQDCWPDEVVAQKCVVNDISRLNATQVHAVVQPRTLADVCAVLKFARETGARVSMRGTRHSMGGQSIVKDGIVLDMTQINHMRYNASEARQQSSVAVGSGAHVEAGQQSSVTVGSGATWAQLIQYLNTFGKAPRTLQSYCSFSVGGTLAVNGHGITNDFCLAESVHSMTDVTVDGTVMQCSRGENGDLFRLCLGGYGLFGVIYEVTMKVDDNLRLHMDTMSIQVEDLPHVYDRVLQDEDVQMKLARVDITTFESVDCFIFRPASRTPTVSALPCKPREMTPFGRLMYKWFAGPFREARFALEKRLGVALDWAQVSDRNEMLFESAAPLAQLYSPLVHIDDTFVLQEYFIPRAEVLRFISLMKPIVLDGVHSEKLITLLNITIRFVHHDTHTALPYASHKSGMYAFVLYYRLRRTSEADARLAHYHNLLADAALSLDGTFYLPYRHHYSDEQLAAAYPGFSVFCKAKSRWDPAGILGNLWFDRYSPNHWQPLKAPGLNRTIRGQMFILPPVSKAQQTSCTVLPLLSPVAVGHRRQSFRQLMLDPKLKALFFDVFLHDIFRLQPSATIARHMARALYDSRVKDDMDFYASLCSSLSGGSGAIDDACLIPGNEAAARGIGTLWNGIKQLSEQKHELVRETMSILSHLGLVGRVHSYVSVGDHGKIVLPLRAALGMQGPTWVVHDTCATEEQTPAVLERGAHRIEEIGQFAHIDYFNLPASLTSAGPKPGTGTAGTLVQEGTIDLLTINQGLHHLPPEHLPVFLDWVYRILRPGGVFIFREHALDEECKLLPMLDCAHAVFNAVTGVTRKEEEAEIRAFRPIEHWRCILASAGFVDCMLYEMQEHDPTIDLMLAFRKPYPDSEAEGEAAEMGPALVVPQARTETGHSHGLGPAVSMALNQLPAVAAETASAGLERLLTMIPAIRAKIQALLDPAMDGERGSDSEPTITLSKEMWELLSSVDKALDPAFRMLSRLRPYSLVAQPVQVAEGPGGSRLPLIPHELLLLEPEVRQRAKQGNSLAAVLVQIMDGLASTSDGAGGKPTQASKAGVPADSPRPGMATTEHVLQLMGKLSSAIPALQTPDAVLQNFGLSVKALTVARSALAATTKTAAAERLAQILDAYSWEELQRAAPKICEAGHPPTMSRVLDPNDPWHAAALAVLGCPSVRLSHMQMVMAGSVGLGPLVELWKAAQQRKRPSGPRTPAMAEVQTKLDVLCPLREHKGPATDIAGVVAVISAHAEVRSITGLLSSAQTDVTEQARAALDPISGVLALSNIPRPPGLHMGALTFHVRYRAKPDTAHISSWTELQSQLEATGNQFNSVTPMQKLSHALGDAGLSDPISRAGNGPNNLYKLPEWLQVEIMQNMSDSLDHTPWFRYPFMTAVWLYGEVLLKEVRVVACRYGLKGALASNGFVTDAVPAVVMGLLFGQMALMAYPLRVLLGSSNPTDSYVEELVLTAPSGLNGAFWQGLDARITQPIEAGTGLYVLTVPTFKPLTEVLMSLACRLPSATLLLVSHHSLVQVKVYLPVPAAPAGTDYSVAMLRRVQELCQLPGCKKLFTFAMPRVGDAAPPPVQLAMQVETVHLLPFLRVCADKGLALQVYDFN